VPQIVEANPLHARILQRGVEDAGHQILTVHRVPRFICEDQTRGISPLFLLCFIK